MQCLRSGPPKVSYLAPLEACFSPPLAAFQVITGCRVLICPYYDSLGKEELSTVTILMVQTVHLTSSFANMSIIFSVFCVKPSQ